MNISAHKHLFILGALLILFGLPLAFSVSADLTGALVNVRQRALESRADVRKRDRQYWKAVEIYQNRKRDGEEGLVPPRIDDASTIEFYLGEGSVPSFNRTREGVLLGDDASSSGKNTPPSSTTTSSSHSSTPSRVRAQDDTSVKTEEKVNLKKAAPKEPVLRKEISARDRILLRSSTRSNSCSRGLARYASGLFHLCKSMTEEVHSAAPRRHGFINLNQAEHSKTRPKKPASLKLRLQMLREANDRSNRKEDTRRLRATPYIK